MNGEEVITHIDALMELAGLDKSESASYTFIELLDEAVIKAREMVRKSDGEGLHFDCRWIIVETLLNWKAQVK